MMEGEERSYRYDAFISYRHLPKEQKVAILLQRLLERQKVPAPGRKGTGKEKRLLRIFRDESELQTSSDLGNDLREALEQSRYFIVICSKGYLESAWCMEELDYFRKINGESNQRILPLLIEGEPEEVFPKQLRMEKRQEGYVEVEPLSANICAKSERKMLRLLHTEALRIAAPIIGCRFDDLYQRRQRKKRQQVIAISAAIVFIAVGFSCYSMYMFNRISQKQSELYVNESKRLADEAERQCENGDYRLAMLLAEAALPKDLENPERPFVTEAETAFRNAAMQQMAEEEYQPLKVQARIYMDAPAGTWQVGHTYADGTKIAVTDYENTYLYDTETGMLLFSCKGCEVYFNEDATRAAGISNLPGERKRCQVELYLTQTGQAYYSGQYEKDGETSCLYAVIEEETQECYVVAGQPENPAVLDVVDAQGKSRGIRPLPEKLRDVFEALCYRGTIGGGEDRPQKYPDFYPESLENEENQMLCKGTEAIRAKLEESGYEIRHGKVLPDGDLVLLEAWGREGFSYYDGQELTGTVLYSQNTGWSVCLAGECYLDKEKGLIYQKTNYELRILSYQPENIENYVFTDTYGRTVSKDGSRFLDVVSGGTSGSYTNKILRVWDTGNLSEPLLEQGISGYLYSEAEGGDSSVYYTTPDMGLVFLQTAEGSLQLWRPGGECLLELVLDIAEEERVSAVSVNREGSLLAVGYSDRNGARRAEVRSAADGSLLHSYEVSNETGMLRYLEFADTGLLISTANQSVLIDLGQKEEAKYFSGGNVWQYCDSCVTADGVLFCTAYIRSGRYLTGAFDIESGERIFGEATAFQYDEESGALIYHEYNGYASYTPNKIHVAYRDKNGMFQDAYTIFPQENEVGLGSRGRYTDGKYLLLNGTNYCEVYEISTGEKVLALKDGTGAEEEQLAAGEIFALADGCVYDIRIGSAQKAVKYPIMGLNSLRELAEQYLVSENGRRELTKREQGLYFVGT